MILQTMVVVGEKEQIAIQDHEMSGVGGTRRSRDGCLSSSTLNLFAVPFRVCCFTHLCVLCLQLSTGSDSRLRCLLILPYSTPL